MHMKTTKYFIISALALLAFSCQDDEVGGEVQSANGEEVQFGAALDESVSSRTIYGDETATGFPIYWANGDKVIVSSPEAASGFQSATYQVGVKSATQNYASTFEKIGDTGVRWGDGATGTFYSMYPAHDATNGASVGAQISGNSYSTYTVTMPAQQDNNIDASGVTRSDMRACFMYAVEAGVTSGETVNLKYVPLSTAVRFTLNGPTSGEVGINYIRLIAPEGTNINGTFTVDMSAASDTQLPTVNVVDGRHYVTMNVADATTGAYLTLGPNRSSIEVNMFLLLEREITITGDWYILVGTTSGTEYRKNLVTNTGNNTTLVPGKIHYLGNLPALSASGDWDASNWMVNLQRNVYLSEISIPGSWNSLNSEYQTQSGTYIETINSQYQVGVRAFHLDTRWIATGNWNYSSSNWGQHNPPTITALGIANGGDTYKNSATFPNGVYTGNCMTENAPTIEGALTAIANNVKDNEYMVVICTFAQNSYNYTSYGASGTGDWRHAISDACNATDITDKIIDASTLTPSTTVADVLGKVIVITNTYTEGEVSGSKSLYMNYGMTLVESTYTTENYHTTPLTYNNNTSTGLNMYCTHAQICKQDANDTSSSDRGYAPTLTEREKHVQNILTWSQNNYSPTGDGTHNTWIYIGLGGYIELYSGPFHTSDDQGTVASTLNSWMQDKITAMETAQSYYPVGIVLVNYAINYSSLINNMLQMNNKYRKTYDPNRSPVDGTYINGSGSSSSTVQSAAVGYSSGMVDSQTDAIGWTKSR